MRSVVLETRVSLVLATLEPVHPISQGRDVGTHRGNDSHDLPIGRVAAAVVLVVVELGDVEIGVDEGSSGGDGLDQVLVSEDSDGALRCRVGYVVAVHQFSG